MNWIDKIIEAGEFKATAFEVTDMDFFGPPTPEKLAFYKGKLEATNKKGVKVASNICNNRGGCTAILIVVAAKIGKGYKKLVAMVEQDRLPSGGQRIECVAGMKDLVTGSVKGPIIKEILEELPIDDIKEDDPRIFPLGKIWPSPGWNDYIIFEEKKYGIPHIYKNIHRENNCFGLIQEDYYVSCECHCCTDWGGCSNPTGTQYYKCSKCNYTYSEIKNNLKNYKGK
jgi:hypothetical protein